MKIKYNLTEEDYLSFSLYHAKHSEATRKSLRTQLLIFPMLFLIIAFLYTWIFKQPVLWPLIIFAVLSLLWIVLYPKYFYNFVRRYAKNMLQEAGNNGLLGDHVMTFSEKGIVDSTSSGKTNRDWADIINLKENDDYLYIYSSKTTAYIVPKRALTSVEKTRDYIQTHLIETE